MELADYFRILRRHWLGVILIIALSLGLAAAFTATQEKVYAADASGFVVTGGSPDPALGSVNDQLSKSRAASYVRLATSRSVADRVIDDLNLDTDAADLVQQIDVQLVVDTVLIEITARAATPLEAQAMADAWMVALADEVEEIEDPRSRERTGTPQVLPIAAAALPTEPVSPNPARNLALGGMLGLLLAVAYAVMRYTLDRRVRSVEDIERLTDVSVVGTIPSAPVLKRAAEDQASLAVEQGIANSAAGPASESFRKLRTNLMYMNVDNPPRVVVVTSPMPGDGKSTVAANLAAAIASGEEKVILIDADLRRPTVATEFGLVEGVGLSDVLAGRIDVLDALQVPPGREDLKVLAAGTIPPNPSELLSSQAMWQVLRKLSADAFVVIDAPPLLPVTDSAILATKVDGAFVVVSAGKTLDKQLETALRNLDSVDVRPLGIILNRISKRDVGSGYYGEYYGYAPEGGRRRKGA